MTNMKIYNADCLQVMEELPNTRLCLTDIPYGEVTRGSSGLRKLDKGNADIETFNLVEFLEKVYEKHEIFIIFCGNEQYSTIYKFFNDKSKQKKGTTRQIIWGKTNPSPMNGEYVYLSGTENAVWFKKRGTGKLNCRCKKNVFNFATGSSKYHPTEKNHKLLQDLILDNTNEGDTVTDYCTGSGSTGVVAVQNNRNFIGVELNEEYYNIAKSRITDVMPR